MPRGDAINVKNMIIDKPLICTRHCWQRMKEFNIPKYKILTDLPRAIEIKKPKTETTKYDSNKCKYYEWGGIIYTVITTTDKYNDLGGIYLVLSVYDKKVDIPPSILNKSFNEDEYPNL